MTASLAEAIRARRDPSPRSLAVFDKAGVDALSLAFDDDGYPNPIGVDRVVFGFEQRFEYERDAPLCATEACNAFVIAARDRDGIAADMLAWSPRRRPPFDVGLWLGKVPMLGMEQVELARGEPGLPVHASIEEWLRHRRRGVVIFDYWQAAEMLHMTAPLLVRDAIHGAWLRDALTIPAPKSWSGRCRGDGRKPRGRPPRS